MVGANDRGDLFGATPSSPEVAKFWKENPNANWRDCLNFTLDRFPQVANGQTQWLLEGGVPIYLIDRTRDVPEDVDIVARSKPMSDFFVNGRKFDVKSTEAWFRYRSLDPSPTAAEFLLSNPMQLDFDGRPVYSLNRTALALSKKLPWASGPQRPKDESDIAILGVTEADTEVFRQQLLTHI